MVAARPKHLRLLRPFALLAIAAGLGGVTLGFVLLEAAQWYGTGFAWTWRQLHGQLQVFGFLVPFVTGFAVYLVPRVSGGMAITAGVVARSSLALQAAGVVLTVSASIWRDQPSLRRAAAACVAAGVVLAAIALRGPVSAHAAALGGRTRAGYLWLLEGALWLLALAGVADGLALWTSAEHAHALLEPRWAAAAWRLAIEGFAVGMALAISARMFTGFLGIDPGRAYPASQSAYKRSPSDQRAFWIATLAWVLSVVVGAAAELFELPGLRAAADLLFASSAIAFALRLGLAKVVEGLAIDRTVDRWFAFGARASYALLVLGAIVGAGAAVGVLSGFDVAPIWSDARRHAITIGFLFGLIATMAGRLAPGFSGRRIWAPSLRLMAIASFTASGALRVFEGVAAQWDFAPALWLSAFSGVVAVIGFAAFLASLIVTLATAPRAH